MNGLGQKVGIFLPKSYHQIAFKIIDGDKAKMFSVAAKKLGNFAFLLLEYKSDEMLLNREYQDSYTFTVRAIAKKKKSNTLEASTTLYVRILDENDNSPMFRATYYSAVVDDWVLIIIFTE